MTGIWQARSPDTCHRFSCLLSYVHSSGHIFEVVATQLEESFSTGKERMQQQEVCIFSKEADAALFERYAASIFAYLRLHAASLEDAEDLLIEVFTAAFEQDNLSWLAAKQHIVWLRRVAQNKLVDRYRRASRYILHPLDEVTESLCIEEDATPEQVALRREELEGLRKAVNTLSVPQQQILQLRLGDGLRFAEIAVLLDKRESAVRKLYSRTLAQLRAYYNLR